MLESKLQAQIIKYLNNVGYVIKVIVGNKKGIPDIIMCYKGLFVAIEVKTTSKPTALQTYNMLHITKNKRYSIIAYSLEDVKSLLQRIDNNETIAPSNSSL